MADERLGASFQIDITNLRAGLAQANRLIRESEAEFRSAAAGIDKWSESEEGLKKRQATLNEQIDIQKKKINALNSEKQRLIEKLTAEGKSQEEVSRATDSVNKQITNESKQLDKLQRDLDNTTNALDELGDESDDAGDAVKKAGDKAEKSSGGFTVLKGAIANLVADGFRKAIDAAKEFGKSMITVAAEVKASNSQFTQTFGDLEEEATSAIKKIADSTGILDTRLQSTGAGIFAFARSSGASTEEAMELMQEALIATADSAAYYDRSLEDSAETLQSFLKGNFANDAALGVSATEFTRNAKATELFGKKYNDLTEIEKQKTLLKMVTDSQKLSGAMGQAARESDGFENVMGNVNETWKQFKAKVGTPVLENLIPVIQDATAEFVEFSNSVNWDKFGKKVTNSIKGIIEKGKELIPSIKEIIKQGKELGNKVLPVVKTALKAAGEVAKFVIKNFDVLVGVVGTAVVAFKAFKAAMAIKSAITATTTAISGLSTGVSLATKMQTGWNAAMSANPIGAVLTAVGLLTAGIVLLANSEDDATKKQDVLNESQRKAVDAAKDAAQAYSEQKEEATKLADAELANIDYTKQLWGELQTLTDKNGKVTEGYEGRAQFILGQLNEALGTEYSMNDGIIQQYGEIADSIDTIIEKRKAQILLDAYQETYANAVKQVADAEEARAIQAQEVAKQTERATEAEKKYSEFSAIYAEKFAAAKTESQYRALESDAKWLLQLSQNKDKEKEKLDDVLSKYAETENYLYGYYADISTYEQASTAILAGESDKAIEILSKYGSGFQTVASTAKMSADEQKKVLEQQVIDTEVNAQLMEQAYKDGVEGVSAEMVKTAKDQADEAKKEFLKVGGDITKGIAEGAEGEEKTNWTLSGSMQRLIDKAVKAARKAMEAKSPSRRFKREVGRLIPAGIAVGITDGTNEVVKSVKKQVNDIQKAYDLSGLTNSVDVGISSSANKANGENGKGKQNKEVIVNQTNYYSQAHSRYELYKAKKQIAAAVRLATAEG